MRCSSSNVIWFNMILWMMRYLAHFPSELITLGYFGMDGNDIQHHLTFHFWNGGYCGFKDPLQIWYQVSPELRRSCVWCSDQGRIRQWYDDNSITLPFRWLTVSVLLWKRILKDFLRLVAIVSGKLNWKSMKDRYYPADWLHLAQRSRWSDWANVTLVAAN